MTQRERTYQCWSDMKQRCTNVRHKQYKNYGARGISVCLQWSTSFASFLADMGLKPDGMTIDRINNDGNYQPNNCRWATPAEQRKNQRTCVYLEHNGIRLTVEEWGRKIGRHPTTVRNRLRAGWLLSDVLDPEKQHRGRTSRPRTYAAIKGAPDDHEG